MKLAFLQLLLVGHAACTGTQAGSWTGESVIFSYQPTVPSADATSEENKCQREGFLQSAKTVHTSAFKYDDDKYCETITRWVTSSDLEPYGLQGIPVNPDDATFTFDLPPYAVGDAVPYEEQEVYSIFWWTCTSDGRLKRHAHSCTDNMCNDCDYATPGGVTYDAGTSATDFDSTHGGMCLGMTLDAPPGDDWAKWHFKAISTTTTSGDESLGEIPSSCGSASPPSGLHLAADDAKMIFGPNGECEIRKVPGESKLVSTCEIAVQSD